MLATYHPARHRSLVPCTSTPMPLSTVQAMHSSPASMFTYAAHSICPLLHDPCSTSPLHWLRPHYPGPHLSASMPLFWFSCIPAAFCPLVTPPSHSSSPIPYAHTCCYPSCPCNTSAYFGPYQHFTIPVCPGHPRHAMCSHGTPITNSGPHVVPHVTSRPCDNTPANALQAHQSPICPCLNCALIMPLCCPHVLASLRQFPSMCLAIFHHIYSSRLCLGCAMHLAVPFHSGHAPPASHAYPGTFKFKPLPLSAPLPALIQSLCSFNRILTCPPSNLHGICEVGCYQFFHQSLLGLG